MMGDLDLLSQGHSFTGHILRTIGPTELIFCMGDQVTMGDKVTKVFLTSDLDLFFQVTLSLAYFKVYYSKLSTLVDLILLIILFLTSVTHIGM
jgi:hypothetical protein